MSQETSRTIKSHCNECLQQTNHEIIAERRRTSPEVDESGFPMWCEWTTYRLVQCKGCENISLQTEYMDDSRDNPVIEIFPPAVSRKLPEWVSALRSDNMQSLFREVYSTIHSGNNCLAMMGMRAIIDTALTDKLTDIGGFKEKLEGAKKEGWISQKQYEILKAAIDAGDAAAHRAYKPDTSQLYLVLDIVENFIHLLYVLRSNAQIITKDTPARKKKA